MLRYYYFKIKLVPHSGGGANSKRGGRKRGTFARVECLNVATQELEDFFRGAGS